MSEPLREQEGQEQVDDQQRPSDETHDVLEAHSRSTPLTINAASAKNATVTITNTTSAIRCTPVGRWPVVDHTGESSPAPAGKAAS